MAVYAPTEVCGADEKEMFYAKLDSDLDQCSCRDTLIVLDELCVGSHGSSIRNINRSLLLNFEESRRLKIADSWFQRPKLHRWTWNSNASVVFAANGTHHPPLSLYIFQKISENLSWCSHVYQLYGDEYTNSGKPPPSPAPVLEINNEHIADPLLVTNKLGSFFSQNSKGSHLPPQFTDIKLTAEQNTSLHKVI